MLTHSGLAQDSVALFFGTTGSLANESVSKQVATARANKCIEPADHGYRETEGTLRNAVSGGAMAERIALAAVDAPHQEISKFGVLRRNAKLPRDLLDTWGTRPETVAVGVEKINLIPVASGNSALDRNVGECALQSDD